MALSIKDYTIIKVAQATHSQIDVSYGSYRSIQCSCMSPIFVSWTSFKSPVLWDKFDVDCVLREGNQLFNLLLTNSDILVWKTYYKSSW